MFKLELESLSMREELFHLIQGGLVYQHIVVPVVTQYNAFSSQHLFERRDTRKTYCSHIRLTD